MQHWTHQKCIDTKMIDKSRHEAYNRLITSLKLAGLSKSMLDRLACDGVTLHAAAIPELAMMIPIRAFVLRILSHDGPRSWLP